MAMSSSTNGQHYSPTLPPPAREFLVNVEMWTTFANIKHGKNKTKSSRSRPASSLFTGSASASTSQDDLAHAHSTTTDTHSHYSTSTSTTTFTTSNVSKKSGISSLFSTNSSSNNNTTGLSDLALSGPLAEKAAKAGAPGFWRGAVCKLSGEGGVWPGSNSATPTGSALLTIYSSDDNTLQHVINVHKLTSTDVRSTDKSLFGRTDVLAIWGHPAAMSLSTHPTLDPIYLSFSSPDAHNTWLVLLRSYTSPEIYGRMISTEKSTGGLYRMWRQIEMVVVQSKFTSPVLSSSSSNNGLGNSTLTNGMKEKKSIGVLFSKDKDKDTNLDIGGGNNGRPGTAPVLGTNNTTTTTTTDLLPLGLTNSHTPSVITATSSFTSASTTTGTGTGVVTPSQGGVDGSGTPTGGTISLRSQSTNSLPTSEGESSGNNNHTTTTTTTTTTTSAREAKAQAKEKEKKEKEREKERKEKEKKEREKEKKKKIQPLPALFAEVVLDGEVCGRTTVKRANPLFSSSSSASSTARPNTAPSSTGVGTSNSGGGGDGGGMGTGTAGPEWFENFLFGDLPSFGNMFISVWKAPEKTRGEEKDKSSSSSSTTTTATTSTLTTSSSVNNIGLTSITSNLNGTAAASSSLGLTPTTTTMSGSTTRTNTSGRVGGGMGVVGGAKGTQFLGRVEISIPNFRRGEWVEGWWPVYAHANAGASGNKDGVHHPGIGALGIGTGAMGMGGMSGVGGVAGAMIQVGELKLKIKVDEEIILPSRAYKNVLDALEQRNYLDVLSDLEQKLRIDHPMISNHIVSLAVARNRLLKDIVQLAEREVMMAVQSSSNTLFRGNTVLTKTMELAMAWYGRAFLDASVGPIIRRMINENVEIEVDPSRLPSSSSSKRPSTKDSFRPSTRDSYRPGTQESLMMTGGDEKNKKLQEQGIRLLEYWCNEFWSQIYFVRMECPVELRRLFGHIRMMVERRFGVAGRRMEFDPNDPTGTTRTMNTGAGADMLPWQAISSFVFLRFIVPAILNPHLFGIWPGMPPKGVIRSLTLLAKCTQSLANLNPGAPQKEDYMRGIRNCLERNTVTMIDYLACVSSLPDQFSPAANSSSFLSGPDKHDRLHVINSLRERLTGAGNTIPTLYKDAIPLLPYALDVPKHLAILSSAVVRNARTGGASSGIYGGVRSGSAGNGANIDDTGGWSLSRFSDLCFDVEAQALKSVATLAQGAASAGAFGGPRTKRSTSVSSTGGVPNGTQHGRPGSSRGITPTGPPASGSNPSLSTTPTQNSPAPWNNQVRRPGSSRSIITPTGPHGSNVSPGPSPGGNSNISLSPQSHTSGSPAKELSTPGTAQVITLKPPTKRKSSARPSTAPSTTSSSHLGEPFIRERKASNTSSSRVYGPDASPAAASFRYLPPEQSYVQEARRPEDVGLPETPISQGHSSNSSGGRHAAYPTIHRGESDSYVPFHYPSRYQGSSEGLRTTTVSTKSERRSSSARIKEFMKRPSTTSGSPSLSAPTSATAQRPPWTWTGGGYRSRSGEDVVDTTSQSHSPATKTAPGGADAFGNLPRRDTAASGEQKKKKGLFAWLGKK